jgi:hypothetical protein
MDKLDIDLIAPCATKEHAEEIMRRSRAGQMGTICPPRSVRESIYYYQGNGRFRWLRQLIHTLRYGCD